MIQYMTKRKPTIIRTEVVRYYVYFKDKNPGNFLFDGDWEDE